MNRSSILRFAVSLLAVATLSAPTLPAHADDSWLDAEKPVNWNTIDSPIPRPSTDAGNDDPRCLDGLRDPETPEDYALVAAGWKLDAPYTSGYGVRMVTATSTFDGMCRPVGYQVFIFVNGEFAGTLSPTLMVSRFDGALSHANLLYKAESIDASYLRYTPNDPLCCPSATSSVSFQIQMQSGRPIVVPIQAYTTKNP